MGPSGNQPPRDPVPPSKIIIPPALFSAHAQLSCCQTLQSCCNLDKVSQKCPHDNVTQPTLRNDHRLIIYNLEVTYK